MSIIHSRTEAERSSLYEQHKPRFDHYLSVLKEWNRSVNLFARSKNVDVLADLLLPCLACAESSLLDSGSTGVDLGSGGGFPGVVLAIARPDVNILLTERVRKKTSFLALLIQELQLTNVNLFLDDIKFLPEDKEFDFITARYFSDTVNIFSFARSHLKAVGSMLLFKPDSAAEELASQEWSIADKISVGPERSLFQLKYDDSSNTESRTA